MDSKVYYNIKQKFGKLDNLRQQINAIHSIRNQHNMDNITLKEVESELCNMYANEEMELIENLTNKRENF